MPSGHRGTPTACVKVDGGGSSLCCQCQCYDEIPHFQADPPRHPGSGRGRWSRWDTFQSWWRLRTADSPGSSQGAATTSPLTTAGQSVSRTGEDSRIYLATCNSISSDTSSLSSGGSDCPPREEDIKIKARGGCLTEISSNSRDIGQSRDNSRGNEKNSITKTVSGKENDLVVQVCL